MLLIEAKLNTKYGLIIFGQDWNCWLETCKLQDVQITINIIPKCLSLEEEPLHQIQHIAFSKGNK